MANSFLINIGMNDTLQDVIRKVNSNFLRLSANQTQQTKTEIRIESARTDNAIGDAGGAIDSAVESGLKQIEARVQTLLNESTADITERLASITEEYEGKLEDKFQELASQYSAPPIGTYLICEYNPNNQWPSTKWSRLDDIEDIPMWKRTS